jgi:hypothetical protein
MRHIISVLFLFLVTLLAAKAQMCYLPMEAPGAAGNNYVAVPPQVAVEFRLNHPKVAKVYWKREYDTTYMALFNDSTIINVNYSPAGEKKYTEVLLAIKNIPGTIISDIAKRYKGWAVLSGRLIIASGGKRLYSALIQKSDRANSYDLTYDGAGKFICSSPPLPKILP